MYLGLKTTSDCQHKIPSSTISINKTLFFKGPSFIPYSFCLLGVLRTRHHSRADRWAPGTEFRVAACFCHTLAESARSSLLRPMQRARSIWFSINLTSFSSCCTEVTRRLSTGFRDEDEDMVLLWERGNRGVLVCRLGSWECRLSRPSE